MKLLIKEGPNSGQELDVDSEVVVGRDPASASLVIEDPEASRRHASLTPGGSGVTVEDLGSTNGTYVNGERLESARDASEGDEIRIGNTVLAVHGAIEATRVSAIPEPADSGATAVSPIPDSPAEPEPVAASGPPEPPAAYEPPAAPEPPGPPPAAQPPAAPPGPPAFAEQPPGPPPPPGGGSAPPSPGAGQGFGSPGQEAPPAQPPDQAPPGAPPSSYPPVAYGGGGGDGYPVDFDVPYPSDGIDRWRPFLHGILVFPHAVVLFFILIGVLFASIGAWFAILFTGKYPPGIFNFILGFYRWQNRVTAYNNFMVDKYPPFTMDEDPQYPVRTRIDYPPDGKIARWRVFVAGIMAFPHYIVLLFLVIAQMVVFLVAFVAVTITRKWPEGLFKFALGVNRWSMRVGAYTYWMTEEYPPFRLEP
jgi:hypothetical protein